MVSEAQLHQWIRDVRAGRRSAQEFVDRLKQLPFQDLGFARIDTHRRLRRGLPEVIFCEGKTVSQIAVIAHRLAQAGELVVLTRLDPHVFESLASTLPQFRYDPVARLAFFSPRVRTRLCGLVPVVTGGTSDLPIAEEAALTLTLLGSRIERLYDVGVAGVHRLLSEWRLLRRARAIVVIAGMEGALPSVVAGIVACPVIAVPTSVGYGASFHGVAALLSMLNSCAPGIGVVNIDNGFGAAYLAHSINQPSLRR